VINVREASGAADRQPAPFECRVLNAECCSWSYSPKKNGVKRSGGYIPRRAQWAISRFMNN